VGKIAKKTVKECVFCYFSTQNTVPYVVENLLQTAFSAILPTDLEKLNPNIMIVFRAPLSLDLLSKRRPKKNEIEFKAKCRLTIDLC